MSEYLVEVFVSRAVAESAMPRLEDVSGAAESKHVHLLRSILIPEDETCFYHFEGPSGEAVREAATRSGLQVERVVQAVSETRVVK